jgi:hypothetical protein
VLCLSIDADEVLQRCVYVASGYKNQSRVRIKLCRPQCDRIQIALVILHLLSHSPHIKQGLPDWNNTRLPETQANRRGAGYKTMAYKRDRPSFITNFLLEVLKGCVAPQKWI